MDSFVYWENGNRKVVTSDEFIAMVCPSDSEDGLEFDDSDEDPTINVQDIESSDTNSDSEPGTDIQTVSNSNMNDTAKSHVHENSPSAPEVPTAAQIPVIKSRRNVKKHTVLWKKQSFPSSADKFPFIGNDKLQQTIVELSTPYQFFKYFFTDEIISKIVNETNLYAIQQNTNKPIDCTNYDIYKFFGICIISSLAPPANIRDLWNDVFGVELVKQTMSQKYFERLHSTLHFNDNSKRPDPQSPESDKLYKIRPILDYLNQRCLSVPMGERLSIDEQMCATKARHHMKMYMKDKPHKWGYKLFVLCGDMGFAHKFEIYSGQENDPKFRADEEPDIGASGNVVVRLSREVPRDQNYKLYFDRYYTSLDLAMYLFRQGIQCVGTIQRNRIPNCKFKDEKDLKKESRGYSEEFTTNLESVDISTVLYKDNSNVSFLSSFVGELPKSEVRRFDRKKKEHIMVPCPAVVSVYNSHMGNVDLLDSNIGRHHIKIRSKRWYLRIFFHLLDTMVINSWILYRRMLRQTGSTDTPMNQKKFRTELAQTLCQVGPEPRKRGRPSSLDPIESKRVRVKGSSLPPKDVRLDPVNHWPKWNEKRTTCKNPNCKGYTYVSCEKCKVNLCLNKANNCFTSFHKK